MLALLVLGRGADDDESAACCYVGASTSALGSVAYLVIVHADMGFASRESWCLLEAVWGAQWLR